MARYCDEGGGTGCPGVPTVRDVPSPESPFPRAEIAHRLGRRQGRECRLDGLEVAIVGSARDGQLLGFLRNVRSPVAGIRVAAHPLWAAAATVLGLALDGFEHPCERARIVTSPSHDLRAQQIGLLFEVATVSEEQCAKAELASLHDRRSGRTADHRAAYRSGNLSQLQPGVLRLRRVGGPMPQ